MKRWSISKQFDFCYGHRVWTQVLNSEYSLDTQCACRHLHGHQGLIKVFLDGEVLERGMVTDFKHLNWFKKWLDDTLDHKFIIDMNDPLREVMFPLSFNSEVKDKLSNCRIVQKQVYQNSPQHIQELYEGLVLVDFIPTSENLSSWIASIIEKKMEPLGVKVSKVEFYETPKSCSTFINE